MEISNDEIKQEWGDANLGQVTYESWEHLSVNRSSKTYVVELQQNP